MLFAIDDHSSNLLVHENKDSAQKSRNRGSQDCPPWIGSYWTDQPTSIISGGLEENIKNTWSLESNITMWSFKSRSTLLLVFPLYLKFAGHLQLLGGYSNGIIKQDHDDNGEENCKVTDHRPHLGTGGNFQDYCLLLYVMSLVIWFGQTFLPNDKMLI